MFSTPCACLKRSYPELADIHGARLGIGNLGTKLLFIDCLSTSGETAHALLMANEMSRSIASSQRSSFSRSAGQGNGGSGDEIAGEWARFLAVVSSR